MVAAPTVPGIVPISLRAAGDTVSPMPRTGTLSERFPSIGPAVLAALLLVAVPLGGCVGAPAGGGGAGPSDGQTGPAGTGPSGAGADDDAAGPVPLRFVEEDRPPAARTFTVTVQPEEALLPVGGPLHVATGGEHPFAKVIDVTEMVPVGTHAYVDAVATWEPSKPVALAGPISLQWFSFDLWISDQERNATRGEATLRSYVTNHGPDPASMVLVVLEPERLHEPVEVTVDVNVTYLDDAIGGSHVVAADLAGGAVPVTVEIGQGDTGTGATLHVRGPDDAPVLTAQVDHNQTVTLPAESPPGEYLFTLWANDAPGRLLVPEANLTSDGPRMRTVDTSPEFGEMRPAPAGEVVSWTAQLDAPPYWLGVMFDGLDGRSLLLLEAQVTVTAPDGTAVVDASLTCIVCWYSVLSVGSGLADEAFVPGEYTFTVSAQAAQGFRMAEMVSLYGR